MSQATLDTTARRQEWGMLLGPARVPFLVLGPVCVLLGIGAADWTAGGVNALYAVLALVGGICAHISVNALNEYSDFRSGLDAQTRRTPFSGGSGTLQQRPGLANWALALGLGSLAITCAIGVFFLAVRGLGLLPLGLAGVLVILAYTRWLTHSPLLCLIAPGLGFGTLMVTGTSYVLTGEYSATALLASFVPFFLVSDLLLLNQFPDVEPDRTVGRRHLPIAVGRRVSSWVYGAFLAATFAVISLGVVTGLFPIPAMLGLLMLPLAVVVGRGAIRYSEDIPHLVPFMAGNVLLNLLTPLLLALGLLLG